VIEEAPDQADWLKVPSEVLLGKPEGTDIMKYLEDRGLQDTLLYRRFKEDPDFEARIMEQILRRTGSCKEAHDGI